MIYKYGRSCGSWRAVVRGRGSNLLCVLFVRVLNCVKLRTVVFLTQTTEKINSYQARYTRPRAIYLSPVGFAPA